MVRSVYSVPLTEDVPDFPSALQVAEYLRAYAEHNDLLRHCRLSTTTKLISPSPTGGWKIQYSSGDTPSEISEEEFDRIIITTGPFQKPQYPTIKGWDIYKGIKIHSQEFKKWEEFKGKRVVVVGLGNTGCDIATELAPHAEVFLSHRGGARIMKREINGKPADHMITRRRISLALGAASIHPSLAQTVSAALLDRIFKQSWPHIDPKWKLTPAPPAINAPGAVNDHVIPLLLEEKLKSVSGIVEFTPNGAIFKDEGEIEFDAIIFATGFTFDYSILSPEADPCFSNPEWDEACHEDVKFPYLYQTHFHVDHPDSLAFIGPMRGPSIAAINNGDLSSQAICQVWAGRYSLPPREEMLKWCERVCKRNLTFLKTGKIGKPATDPGEFEPWLNDAAGNGVNEALGWGYQGWKFQASDRRLHSLCKDGVASPHIYRLFDGREGSRKKWDGARDQIFKVNGVEL